MNEKIVKITKRAHAFKGYASSYNVEVVNSFDSELRLKDTESTIEKLTELRGFKFVKRLVLVLKR